LTGADIPACICEFHGLKPETSMQTAKEEICASILI